MSPLLLLAAAFRHARARARALHVEEENGRPPLRDLVSRAMQLRSSRERFPAKTRAPHEVVSDIRACVG